MSPDPKQPCNNREAQLLYHVATSAPGGKLKREVISLTTAGKKPFGMKVSGGFSSGIKEVLREIFDDFVAANLIERHGGKDEDGRLLFRLTEEAASPV